MRKTLVYKLHPLLLLDKEYSNRKAEPVMIKCRPLLCGGNFQW